MEWLKWGGVILTFCITITTGAIGYGKLIERVDNLQAANAEQWQRISEVYSLDKQITEIRTILEHHNHD